VAALYLRHALAVANAEAQALHALSVDFEKAGLMLSAADAAAQAVPLHNQAGQHRRSAESAARATELAARCGGAITPAIRSAARPLPLSPREREIAAMIAAGLSKPRNRRQIAGFGAHRGRPHLPRLHQTRRIRS
jgi:DNA-binding NarL/FixJ family response regulator